MNLKYNIVANQTPAGWQKDETWPNDQNVPVNCSGQTTSLCRPWTLSLSFFFLFHKKYIRSLLVHRKFNIFIGTGKMITMNGENLTYSP